MKKGYFVGSGFAYSQQGILQKGLPWLIAQDGVIISDTPHEGALKIDLNSGAGIACTFPVYVRLKTNMGIFGFGFLWDSGTLRGGTNDDWVAWKKPRANFTEKKLDRNLQVVNHYVSFQRSGFQHFCTAPCYSNLSPTYPHLKTE